MKGSVGLILCLSHCCMLGMYKTFNMSFVYRFSDCEKKKSILKDLYIMNYIQCAAYKFRPDLDDEILVLDNGMQILEF